MLSDRSVILIQDSFARIAPDAAAFSADFYTALFRRAPDVRGRFPADLGPQREKLVATLAFVVRGLGRFAEIKAQVRDLGARHVRYKAEPAHYDVVAAALLETLAARLGPRWTPELERAWRDAYALLSQEMIDAAAAARSAA